MQIRRDGDHVAVVLKASHLTAVGIALAGALGGAALFFGVKTIGVFPDLGSTAAVTLDSAAWWEAQRFEVDTTDRPSRGPSDAPVTIVEFTDYGCPFCRRHATEVLPDLLERYGDRIRYVVRHFPIPALTPNALAAADAAECAYRQDRYWEYREALVRETGSLSAEVLQGKAVAVGLDTESFAQCVADPATRDVVEGDILDAWEHGVTGTPTFFIDGRRFVGARPLEELELYVGLALQTDGN
jgi:protein-disulfide isomerase